MINWIHSLHKFILCFQVKFRVLCVKRAVRGKQSDWPTSTSTSNASSVKVSVHDHVSSRLRNKKELKIGVGPLMNGLRMPHSE